MIRALLIHQAFATPEDAGGTRHFELGSRLVREGDQFTIVASDCSYLTGKRIAPREKIISDIRVLRAYTYSTLHKGFIWRILSFLSFAVTSTVVALRSGPVDIVMGTTPPIFQAVSAYLVAVLRRKPVLLEVRDLWPEFAIDIGVLRNPVLIRLSRWLEGFLYKHATHLLVNSPAYRDYLIEKGVPVAKISFISNGVDVGMFDVQSHGFAVREQFNLGEKFVVTYAGAIGLANNLDILLDSADLLRNQTHIHFLVVGDGKERAVLEQEAHEMQLENVTFAGAQKKSRMSEFLAASDACVAILKNIPMFTTTYPNKVFDYMAAGRPTILLIDGVIRQVVEAAEAGVFVPPGDALALVSAIIKLASDPAEAKAMGERGRIYVSKHFNRETQGAEFVDLMRVLAESPASRTKKTPGLFL